MIIATQLLQIDPIHDLSSNFHAKIVTQLYKIISDTNMYVSRTHYNPVK